MSYDDRMLRPRASRRIGHALAELARLVGALALLGVVVAALVAVSYGGYYVAGRAIGEGVRDSRGPR